MNSAGCIPPGRSPGRVRTMFLQATRSLCLLLALALSGIPATAWGADATPADVPLVINNRTLHVFRAPLGDLSAEERAAAARAHILKALDRGGEGWTSISPTANGVVVALDGRPMFTVSAGDVRSDAGETPDYLANQASRVLQKVWVEAMEHRDPRVNAVAIFKVLAAFALMGLSLVLLLRLARLIHRTLAQRLTARFGAGAESGNGLAAHIADLSLRFSALTSALTLWVPGLILVALFILYALSQFALSRPIGEHLGRLLADALLGGLQSAAFALPGLIVAIGIFLLARIVTQVSRLMFDQIADGKLQFGALDEHTAPATRHLVNAAIWLFALAMAYPYLPGSQTDAFKGLSLLLGVMVSIGASGPVGQVVSGMILAFNRALKVGEYVRIRAHEGTVTHLGLYVTRLRTGTGEEISLPNSLVVSEVTRNFSRNVAEGGCVLDTTVTIGYDTPWRQVHAMLLEAAAQHPGLRKEPPPFVIQTALGDFYVNYSLVAQMDSSTVLNRPQVLSELNAHIQDVFNRYGVQIMSPNYLGDPAQPKIVPESAWYAAPAKQPRES